MSFVYKPVPYRDGTKIIKKYTEPFTDRSGNNAVLTKVDYLDKKNKINEGYVLHVKWLNNQKIIA